MIKLGIIGTGRIAKRFVQDAVRVKNVEIVCVYNPHPESAMRFANEMGISDYTTDFSHFQELVDAVYIASPHETHFSYARELLMSGRHVLCEKPLALSKKQAEELFDVAKEKKCILLEAVKTSYCPGFLAMIEKAQSGAIGEICDVESCFTKLVPQDVRELTDTLYGGSVTELGSYVLLPVLRLLGTKYEQVKFTSIKAGNGLDLFTRIQVTYQNAIGMGKTGLGVKSEGQLLISGTKGYILAEAPWWLTKKFEVRFEDEAKREAYEYPFEANGLWYELEFFAKTIEDRAYMDQNRIGIRKEESIAIASIMEKFLSERGKELC